MTINDIELGKIRPLVFRRYYKRCDEKHISWREELCIYIYTYRNKVGLNVIGNIETAEIYDNNLSFKPQDNMCFWCGDVNAYLGREAGYYEHLPDAICAAEESAGFERWINLFYYFSNLLLYDIY